MEYVLTSAEMKACDQKAIEEYGIGALVLMERAVRPVWQGYLCGRHGRQRQ